MTAHPRPFTFASIPAFVADDDDREIREPKSEPETEVPRGQIAMLDAGSDSPCRDSDGWRCKLVGSAEERAAGAS